MDPDLSEPSLKNVLTENKFSKLNNQPVNFSTDTVKFLKFV